MRPARSADDSADRAAALRITPVSDAALQRLETYADLLRGWQRRLNLIAPSTVPHIWTRHIADSLQLLELAPGAKIWIDLGSGAGFPGIPIACVLADAPGAKVHLVESNSRKAAFLREAARLTHAPAEVHCERIEGFVDRFKGPVDIVTARALAPLNTLLNQSLSLLNEGAVGLFPKGQDVEAELTEAAKYWTINVNLVPSRTDPKGRIVVIRGLQRRI